MSNLAVRRAFVWIVSLVLGLIVTWALVVFFFPTQIPAEAGKGLGDYGLLATILTVIPISLIFVAWLDYFLDTKIHPD
jgi:hypothetical protein